MTNPHKLYTAEITLTLAVFAEDSDDARSVARQYAAEELSNRLSDIGVLPGRPLDRDWTDDSLVYSELGENLTVAEALRLSESGQDPLEYCRARAAEKLARDMQLLDEWAERVDEHGRHVRGGLMIVHNGPVWVVGDLSTLAPLYRRVDVREAIQFADAWLATEYREELQRGAKS